MLRPYAFVEGRSIPLRARDKSANHRLGSLKYLQYNVSFDRIPNRTERC
jgi:hypothetical protein